MNQPPLAPGVLQLSRPGLVKKGDSNLSTASLVSSDSSGGTDLDIGMCYAVRYNLTELTKSVLVP